MNQEYARVKHLIETGFIKEFSDFLGQFQKKTMYTHLHMRFAAYDRRLANPGLFTVDQLVAMASLVNVDPEIIAAMAVRARKKKGKR